MTDADRKLIEEARSQAAVIDYLPAEDVSKADTSALLRRLAAHLATTQAALDEARGALEPFAKVANDRSDDLPDDYSPPYAVSCTMADFRRARALTSTPRGET